MQHQNESGRRAGRPRVVLSIPIAILFLSAVAGWLLALLRRHSPWWLEAAVLTVAVLAVVYLTVMEYRLHHPQRTPAGQGEGGGTHRAAPRFLDSVTGLPSRTWLEQTLSAELARSRRYHRNFSIIVVDIDHFTRINREHGEVAGDWVLENVGTVLRAGVRESDYVARIGDDAFALLLAETPEKGALQLAEKLRASVAAPHAGAEPESTPPPVVTVTVSAGVAVAEDSDTVEELLRRAEAAAMTARRAGGDRVATATF